MQRVRTRRGFTLIELLVTVAILGVLMTGVAAIVIAQSRSYEVNARTRDVVAANRRSISFLETRLRLAGFGVEPPFAFDFPAVLPSSLIRDRTDGPDELVFYARDPGFHRRVTAQTATTLTLSSALTAPIHPGQVLLVTCPSGVGAAYVTVAARATAASVTLMAADGLFPRQTLPDCGVGQQPFVMKVDLYRFFVADVREAGVVRPYLLLDQGLDLGGAAARAYDAVQRRMVVAFDLLPGDGKDVLTAGELAHVSPLAAGVEDFQVAYLMNQPGAGWLAAPPGPPDGAGGNWVLGDNALDAVKQPVPTATAPAYTDEYRHANRFTANPANIRGVRVTLVTRSDTQGTARSRRPAAENRAGSPVDDGFYRNTITTQVYVRNLLSRSNFAPIQVELTASP